MNPRDFYLQVVFTVPLFLVWGAAMWKCYRNWHSHPRTCQWTGIAITIALFSERFVTRLMNDVIQPALRLDWSTESQTFLAILYGSLRSGLAAIALGLLLWVIFRLNEQRSDLNDQNWQIPK